MCVRVMLLVMWRCAGICTLLPLLSALLELAAPFGRGSESAKTTTHNLLVVGRVLGLWLLRLYMGGPQKSSSPYLGYGLDGCTVFQKEFHHFNSILLAGNVKRGKAILQGKKDTDLFDYIPLSSTSYGKMPLQK